MTATAAHMTTITSATPAGHVMTLERPAALLFLLSGILVSVRLRGLVLLAALVSIISLLIGG